MARSNIARRGVCYLCGEEGIVTDDHVPPECLAPKANNSVFYKLPAHETCNQKFSTDEGRFRDYVVAYAKDGIKEAEDAYEKMQRNFERGKEKRGGLLNRDFYRLADNIQQAQGFNPQGIYTGPLFGIKPAKDLDYRSVLTKIARGLHYHHTNEIIPSNYEMFADFVLLYDFKHMVTLQHLNISGIMGDFFAYRGSWANDEPKSGLWYMSFYKSVVGMAGFRMQKTDRV